WSSSNGGSSWIGSALPEANYTGLAYSDDGSLYVSARISDPSVFGGAVLARSTNGGVTWQPLALPASPWGVEQIAISPVDPQRLFVTVNSGDVMTSGNAGSSWNPVALPAACSEPQAITPHPTQAAGVFISCRTLGVIATDNVLAPAWTIWGVAKGLTVNGTDPAQIAAIQVHPNWPTVATLYVGAESGGLFHSSNGGASWSAINHGYAASNIRALAPHPLDTGSSAVVLAGYGDAASTTRPVYRSPDNGLTWAPSHTGMTAEMIRSLVIDPTTVDSNPFTAEPFTVYATGVSMPMTSSADTDGGIYKSTNGGTTWSTIDTGISDVGGYRSMGLVRVIAADPRSCATPPTSGPCATGSGPLQTLYVAGSGVMNRTGPGLPYRSARIYKSTNAGASWTPSETGLPLPESTPIPYAPLISTIAIQLAIDPSTTTTLYVTTALIGSYDENFLYEPSIANGVFKSVDGGANWVHASNGLPRQLGPASSHQDVLAFAINPANSQILYASTYNLSFADDTNGRIYKSIDGGANWFDSSAGISGQDVRALLVDPYDPSGNTVYAAAGGNGADRGGIFRSTDGGATWNSHSIGLPSYAATSLAIPARAPGAPARLLAGTTAGVWDYTQVPDEDADGVPTAVEQSVLAGDGNGDGIPDAQQPDVASLPGPPPSGAARSASGASRVTIAIDATSSCAQLNDSMLQAAQLFPLDPLGDTDAHGWGLVNFSLPNCATTRLRVTFHDADFGADWTWRNYGPRKPGASDSFGWYTFAGARRLDGKTWQLDLDAQRQGNYRNDAHNILFIGGPALLPDLLFDNGFQ
ncbi:MAG: hypothetical protein ABIY56_04785, partial [Dokdonella sp.]